MMKRIIVMCLFITLSLTACKSPTQRAIEEYNKALDKTVEEYGKALDKAVDSYGKALDSYNDAVKDYSSQINKIFN